MEELRRLNQPTVEYDKVADYFFGNTDETCFMANANGGIKVVASASKSTIQYS